MTRRLLLAGVPATGKTWLGCWLAENRNYVHIDAEREGGVDFDTAGLHDEWNELVLTGRAHSFVTAADDLGRPVVVNWGFPVRFLYVVNALQASGFVTWWLTADRQQARAAFLRRGGIDARCFDKQMEDVDREWPLIARVLGDHILDGLTAEGTQRRPEELWSEMEDRCR